MKPTVFEFVGGPWDGKCLRTDSTDYEEQCLAVGCYEWTHHGAIGTGCAELSCESLEFAKRHGWGAVDQVSAVEQHRYLIAERRETETEIVITFEFHPLPES